MSDRDELPPTKFVRLPTPAELAAARGDGAGSNAQPAPTPPSSPARSGDAARPGDAVRPGDALRPGDAARAAGPVGATPLSGAGTAGPGAPFGGFAVSPATTHLRRQESDRGRFGVLLVVGAILLVAVGAVGLLGILLFV